MDGRGVSITTSEANGEQLLACEIVVKAVEDWKSLATGKMSETATHNYNELRQFFKSGWCDLLLSHTELTGEYILDRLEKYRIEQERIAKLKKKRKFI